MTDKIYGYKDNRSKIEVIPKEDLEQKFADEKTRIDNKFDSFNNNLVDKLLIEGSPTVVLKTGLRAEKGVNYSTSFGYYYCKTGTNSPKNLTLTWGEPGGGVQR